MHTHVLQEQLNQIVIPNTQRTLGSEKALRDISEQADGLHIELVLGFPSAHIGEQLAARIQETLAAAGYRQTLHLAVNARASSAIRDNAASPFLPPNHTFLPCTSPPIPNPPKILRYPAQLSPQQHRFS